MAEEYGKWISVKEKLPDEIDDYLVRVKVDEQNVLAFWTDLRTYEGGKFHDSEMATGEVTHWQKLPDPPEGEK